MYQKRGLGRGIIHSCQNAYRAGKSTEIALYDLTENIRDALNNKETAVCAVLEIYRAFDNTSHLGIHHARKNTRVATIITEWIRECAVFQNSRG